MRESIDAKKKKTQTRCFLHNLRYVSPSDPAYRKHDRLQMSVQADALKLEKRLRQKSRNKPKT